MLVPPSAVRLLVQNAVATEHTMAVALSAHTLTAQRELEEPSPIMAKTSGLSMCRT